ncbi:MAG: DUF4440 domain-containing protein [Patescibacteria group bacterium]|nr:DUF4440 domain-containing protein [Patescibacteria group bacterium]MDE1944137.1 DUF4440 domain-containing protein [Patescibacteria group bacterium]MDE1944758.1 DUF4440 domain-containing protein [Patescibacteria group bacterium]MDE2058019.1 DUF4440 domain-containing protein [Patescibacteria group bacterium]
MNELGRQFYELETMLLQPEVRSSRLPLADDFMEFGSSDSVYRKLDTLESLTTTTDKVVYEISDFEARELSDDCVLTTFKTKRTINDTDVVNSLRSSIWKRTNGGWQMYFHQGTPIR